jgi:hypothetical protein
MAKKITVNDQMQKVLIALKGLLMKQKQKQVTFNEVLANEVTKANAFSQLVSKLIDCHPVIELEVERIAREQGTSEVIQSTLDLISSINQTKI